MAVAPHEEQLKQLGEVEAALKDLQEAVWPSHTPQSAPILPGHLAAAEQAWWAARRPLAAHKRMLEARRS